MVDFLIHVGNSIHGAHVSQGPLPKPKRRLASLLEQDLVFGAKTVQQCKVVVCSVRGGSFDCVGCSRVGRLGGNIKIDLNNVKLD